MGQRITVLAANLCMVNMPRMVYNTIVGTIVLRTPRSTWHEAVSLLPVAILSKQNAFFVDVFAKWDNGIWMKFYAVL